MNVKHGNVIVTIRCMYMQLAGINMENKQCLVKLEQIHD